MYRATKLKFAVTGGLALALAACADESDEMAATEEPADIVAVEYDPLVGPYVLTVEQQERRDALDMVAFQEEYAGYHEALVVEATPSPNMADSGSSSDANADEAGDDEAVNATNGVPERSEMDWSYIDRNDDDRLSVAEYAIWALPMDPTASAANDAKPPYLTADEANQVADSFFYYDRDGDTYLSQQEFASARRGERFG